MRFRIPQYDGCLWPDLDLPVAPGHVIQEPQARSYSYRPGGWKQAEASRGGQSSPARTLAGVIGFPDQSPKLAAKKTSQRLSGNRLSEGALSSPQRSTRPDSPGQDKGEMTVDELKRRLSRLIGVSLTEFEVLFDGF